MCLTILVPIGVIPFYHYCTLIQPNVCYVTLKITMFKSNCKDIHL